MSAVLCSTLTVVPSPGLGPGQRRGCHARVLMLSEGGEEGRQGEERKTGRGRREGRGRKGRQGGRGRQREERKTGREEGRQEDYGQGNTEIRQ